MIYREKHRILNEIQKNSDKGQIIHFLTGDGTNDNFFYDVIHGVMSGADTLRQYYLVDSPQPFDYFVHVVNANNNLSCYHRQGDNIEEINFEKMFPPAVVKSKLKSGGSRKAAKETNQEVTQEAVDTARDAGTGIVPRIEQLGKLLREGKKRVLVFLENLEWIANLYGEQTDHTWIGTLKRWEKYRNLQVVVTISDMEMLKKYRFTQKEIFLGYPSAEEIKYAYFRHILRNTSKDYLCNMGTLDDIAHRMGAGKKSLCACMRILRNVLRKNSEELCLQDFEAGQDKMVEEKVTWEDVRLEDEIKERIKNAVAAFMDDSKERPPRKGLIFTGPPGTGKTLIAKAVANEAKCYFMAPTLADLKGEYIGESSAKVKRLFAEARGNAPTVIFIDEADTVFPSRSLGAGDRDSYGLDMVNQFLQELDGAHSGDQKIFTIAATNRVETVDPAIKSRLSNEPILIPLPSKKMRRLIFDDNLSKGGDVFSLQGKIFEDEVLQRSENMSGRDIMNFVKKLKESYPQLRNDESTAKAFQQIFDEKEDALVEELQNLGIFSRGNIISPDENKLKLADIIGYDDLKAQIALQVDYIQADSTQKKRYEYFGIEPRKGILLYGPPGNGKSMLAKAVAGEYGFYFFKVLSRDFANNFPAEQIKKLERIFTEVIRFSKMMAHGNGIVLFFDEFDSLAGVNVLNSVVRGSILNYIADEAGIRARDSRILLMAATNFVELLDDAIKRQGRIDTHLLMPCPTRENGKKMFYTLLDGDDRLDVPERTLCDEIYEHLCQEKINKKQQEYNKNHINMPEDERKEHLRYIEEHDTPSGAEIETLYKELKEIAFNEQTDAEKLKLDDNVLRKRFSVWGRHGKR